MSRNQSLSVAESTIDQVVQSSQTPAVRFQISEVEQPLDDFEGTTFAACRCASTSPVDQTVQVG